MTNLQHSPKGAKPLSFDLSEQRSIIILVEGALRDEKDPIARGIMNCINSRTPDWKIINDLQVFIREDYTHMAAILGYSLTETIKSL